MFYKAKSTISGHGKSLQTSMQPSWCLKQLIAKKVTWPFSAIPFGSTDQLSLADFALYP